jgi:hypothetical protein
MGLKTHVNDAEELTWPQQPAERAAAKFAVAGWLLAQTRKNAPYTSWSQVSVGAERAIMAGAAVLNQLSRRHGNSRGRGRGGVNMRRRGGSPGWVGIILGTVVCLLFLAFAPMVLSGMGGPDDEVTTTGEIIDYEQTERHRDGRTQTMYSAVYGYTVDGEEHTLRSATSSSSRPNVGRQVEIGYSESNPSDARRTDGLGQYAPLLFLLIPVIALVAMAFQARQMLRARKVGLTLAEEATADAAGAGMVTSKPAKDARAWFRVQQHPNPEQAATVAGGTDDGTIGVASRAAAMVRGEIQPRDTNELVSLGVTPAQQPTQQQPQAQPQSATPWDTGQQQTQPQAQPAQPAVPAGFYPDPSNPGGQRYWDGAAWTTQTRP